jgi:hypothetical protein
MKLFIALIATLAAIFALAVWRLGVAQDECTPKGGVIIQGLNGWLCVRPL